MGKDRKPLGYRALTANAALALGMEPARCAALHARAWLTHLARRHELRAEVLLGAQSLMNSARR